MPLALLLSCEREAPPAPKESAANAHETKIATEANLIPAPSRLTLNWRDYDGTNDPQNAVYILADKVLGRGADGLAALHTAIASLPTGTQINIQPYYGDPGAERKKEYPFDVAEMREFARQHGVELGVPSAK
ncbi:MAG: hypothetical protein NTW19_03820 [Planctomycetota bacterium]|nr:hypothetical protein [Planctomycetota bacterium]